MLKTSPVWWVWKFGGSSLSNYENFCRVAALIVKQLDQWTEEEKASPSHNKPAQTPATHPNQRSHLALVVSAVGGVTNMLDQALERALSASETAPDALSPASAQPQTQQLRADFLGDVDSLLSKYAGKPVTDFLNQLHYASLSHHFGPILLRIAEIHLELYHRIIHSDYTTFHSHFRDQETAKKSSKAFYDEFFGDLINLTCILQAVACTHILSGQVKALALGYGELWSMQLLSLLLPDCFTNRKVNVFSLNARDVLTLRQVTKPRDVRKRLQKLPANVRPVSSAESLVQTRERDGTTSFLPPMARSSLLKLDTPLTKIPEHKSLREAIEQATLHSPSGMSPSLGNMSRLPGPEQYDLKCASHESPGWSETGAEYTSWAFPQRDNLPPDLFPPSGPIAFDKLEVSSAIITPRIDWEASYELFALWFRQRLDSLSAVDGEETGKALLVITGFICRTLDGHPAILGRNGSDTSAVCFAGLLRAEGVTIWSDVAGIYTADPRYVDYPEQIKYITYEEALELAGTGARVLHPNSLLPAKYMRIPLLLKSTFAPLLPGTTVADCSDTLDSTTYGKVVARTSNVCLVTLSNFPLSSLHQFASRLFAAVEKVGGSPLFITQGMTSSAISIAVTEDETVGVVSSLFETFRHDAEDFGSHLRLTIDSDCSLLSVVGRGQVSFIGAMAGWCEALRANNVNIKAVSQSSSELSTTFVVSSEASTRALQALHGVVMRCVKRKNHNK